MRFLGSNFTQNALAAGAPPRTPLGKLKRSPRSLADFRGPLRGRGKGKDKGGERGRRERGKGVLGRERGGRKGKGRGEGGKAEGGGEGRGGGVCVIGVRGDRRPWSDH